MEVIRKSKYVNATPPAIYERYPSDLLDTKLYHEKTFYTAFIKGLNDCGSEQIIECPFIISGGLFTSYIRSAYL